MIPILYPATETQFRSNGLGALKDVMSCEVHEVLNGEYELTMEYPVTGQHFEDIKELCLILAKPSASEDPQPFEIYKVGSEIGGIVTIYAQHISYRLSMIPVKPFTASSPTEAILKLNQYAVYTVPFAITADTTRTGELKIENPMSARAVIGEIIKKYDLEVKWSMLSVHMSDRRGADNGVTISYGKNLTELQHESDLSETITGVLPYWSGMSNSGASSQTIKLVGDVVLDETHDPLYPYHRVVPYDFSNWFGEGVVPTLSDLQTAGAQYLANYHTGLPKEQMDASFIPLWLTEEFKQKASVERVSIGDTIRIVASKINIDARARIVEATWNVLKERYDDLVTGKARNGLSEQFNAVTEKVEETTNAIKTDLQTAIDKATDMITGNNGGYIKFRYDADGKPYEMLVMDNEDIEQAENIWRFNQSGLGHSSNGYNGPYSLAMLMDGSINASMITTGSINANLITTGTLNANLIRAGVIQDAGEHIMFDLNNAELTSISDWLYLYDETKWPYKQERLLTSAKDIYKIIKPTNSEGTPYVNAEGTNESGRIESRLFSYTDSGLAEFEITAYDNFGIRTIYPGSGGTTKYARIIDFYSVGSSEGTTPRLTLGKKDITTILYGDFLDMQANTFRLFFANGQQGFRYISSSQVFQVIYGGYSYNSYSGTLKDADGNTFRVRNGIVCI